MDVSLDVVAKALAQANKRPFRDESAILWLQSSYSLERAVAVTIFATLSDEGYVLLVDDETNDESWYEVDETKVRALRTLQSQITSGDSDSDAGSDEPPSSPKMKLTVVTVFESSASTAATVATTTPAKKDKLRGKEKDKKRPAEEKKPKKKSSKKNLSPTAPSPRPAQASAPSVLPRSRSDNNVLNNLVAVSGEGSVSKLGKLLGQQVVSVEDQNKSSKLRKMLGAEVTTAAKAGPVTLSSHAAPVGDKASLVGASLLASTSKMQPTKRNLKKTYHWDLDCVPGRLDSPNQTLESLHLIQGGYFVALFKNTGTMNVGRVDQSAYFFLKNESKIINYQYQAPHLVSLHENRTIQLYEIDTDTTSVTAIDFDVADPSPVVARSPSEPAIRNGKKPTRKSKDDSSVGYSSDEASSLPEIDEEEPLQAPPSTPKPRLQLLLVDTQVVVLACYPGYYKALVYAFPTVRSAKASSLTLERVVKLTPPESTEQGRVYALRPKIAMCKLQGNQILIGADDMWQLWDLHRPSSDQASHASLLMYETPHQDGESLATGSFNSITWAGDFIAATTIDKCYIWSISAGKRLYTVRSGSILTELKLDTEAVMLGEKSGKVIYRNHVQRKLILDPENSKRNANQSSGAGSLNSSDTDVSADSFGNKVNCLARVSHSWVVSGDESGNVFFWYATQARSCLGKSFTVSGPVVELLVTEEAVIVVAKRKEAKESLSGSSNSTGSAATASPMGYTLEIFEFALNWVEKAEDLLVAPVGQKAPDSASTKRKLKPVNTDLFGMTGSQTSKIQKVLGEHAIPDTPSAGLGNKKLLQVLGADVMLKKDIRDDPSYGQSTKRSLPPHKPSVLVKNAAFFSLDIPEVLNNKFSLWYQTHLMFQNYLVSTYRSSGALILTNASSDLSTTFDNPSPILSYVVQFPFIFTLHKDDVLQYFSVPTREIGTANLKTIVRRTGGGDEDTAPDEEDAPASSSPPPSRASLEALSETGSQIDFVPLGNTTFRSTVLLATPDNELAVVRSHDDYYSVYQLVYHPDTNGLAFQRKASLWPVMDDSSPEDSSASVSSVSSTALRLVESCCKLWGGHMILGNSQEVQLWHLLSESLSRVIPAPPGFAFQSVHTVGDLAICTVRDKLVIFSTVEEGLVEVSIHDAISHVFTTSEYIIIGSASGMVFVIPHQGRLEFFTEPQLAVNSLPASSGPHPAPSLRESKMAQKITCIKKKGMFLFVGHEGQAITLWNIDRNHKVHYIREYATRGQVLDLKVERTSVNALIKMPPAAGKALSLELMNQQPPLPVAPPTKAPSSPHFAAVPEPGLADQVKSLQQQVSSLVASLQERDKKIDKLQETVEALAAENAAKSTELQTLTTQLSALVQALQPKKDSQEN